MADNSILWWLLRGDIKFYLYSDVWKPQDWANWFLENYSYLVAIPFVVIFAAMLRPKRKISFILICLVAMGAFVAVEKGRRFAVDQLGHQLAVRDTKCKFGYLDQVINNYSPSLIARQIAYKINNDSLKNQSFFAPLTVHNTNLVLAAKSPPWGIDVLYSYCKNDNPYWIAARRINFNLLLIVSDKDGAVQFQQLFTPQHCPA
jgi:hypothetical protein